MTHHRLFIIVVVVLAVAFPTKGYAVTIFSEDFEGDAIGQALTNLNNWDVSNGTVDIHPVDVSPRFIDVGWDASFGNIVDLDGSSSNGGIITTKSTFDLAPGTYDFSFYVSGSNQDGGGADLFNVSVGSLYSETFDLNATQSVQQITRSFTAATPTQAKIVFDQDGGRDNFGILIDNVLLETQVTEPPDDPSPPGGPSTIPEPSTFALAVLGLLSLGMTGRRRKRR